MLHELLKTPCVKRALHSLPTKRSTSPAARRLTPIRSSACTVSFHDPRLLLIISVWRGLSATAEELSEMFFSVDQRRKLTHKRTKTATYRKFLNQSGCKKKSSTQCVHYADVLPRRSAPRVGEERGIPRTTSRGCLNC